MKLKFSCQENLQLPFGYELIYFHIFHITISHNHQIFTSSHQHITTSTHQHINTSIHHHINTSKHHWSDKRLRQTAYSGYLQKSMSQIVELKFHGGVISYGSANTINLFLLFNTSTNHHINTSSYHHINTSFPCTGLITVGIQIFFGDVAIQSTRVKKGDNGLAYLLSLQFTDLFVWSSHQLFSNNHFLLNLHV